MTVPVLALASTVMIAAAAGASSGTPVRVSSAPAPVAAGSSADATLAPAPSAGVTDHELTPDCGDAEVLHTSAGIECTHGDDDGFADATLAQTGEQQADDATMDAADVLVHAALIQAAKAKPKQAKHLTKKQKAKLKKAKAKAKAKKKALSRKIPAISTLPRTAVPCHGDGKSGNRVAVYYLYRAGSKNNLGAYRRQLTTALLQANGIVEASAKATGGNRYLRLLTNSSCQPVITALAVPGSALSSFGKTISYVSAHGLNAASRKYVMFADSNVYCGLGTLTLDDQPGAMNASNVGPSWARVDKGCWNGPAAAHEIFHMLGAVQQGAPHFDGTGHCTDERDLMCYDAGGKKPVMRCSAGVGVYRADCGGDDYFNVKPKAGSWLASHWNTAHSSFLYGGGPARP